MSKKIARLIALAARLAARRRRSKVDRTLVYHQTYSMLWRAARRGR